MSADEEENLAIYDEIEIEDMTFDEALQLYHYPCPCGDRFQIALDDLRDEQDIAVCPSCSLMIRVIFDLVGSCRRMAPLKPRPTTDSLQGRLTRAPSAAWQLGQHHLYYYLVRDLHEEAFDVRSVTTQRLDEYIFPCHSTYCAGPSLALEARPQCHGLAGSGARGRIGWTPIYHTCW